MTFDTQIHFYIDLSISCMNLPQWYLLKSQSRKSTHVWQKCLEKNRCPCYFVDRTVHRTLPRRHALSHCCWPCPSTVITISCWADFWRNIAFATRTCVNRAICQCWTTSGAMFIDRVVFKWSWILARLWMITITRFTCNCVARFALAAVQEWGFQTKVGRYQLSYHFRLSYWPLNHPQVSLVWKIFGISFLQQFFEATSQRQHDEMLSFVASRLCAYILLQRHCGQFFTFQHRNMGA